MDRGAEFVALFNELDAHLRRVLRIDRPWDFMNLVNEAVRRGFIHRSLVGELHDCKSLRNLLVHTARYPHDAVAEPSEWGLARFRSIVEGIVRPVRLIPAFRRDLKIFDPDQPLAAALKHMHGKDYSQVVVYVEGERYTLLTLEGIARWLAANIDGELPDPAGVTVADALQHEPRGSCAFLPRDASLEEARRAFELPRGEKRRPRVFAAIITATGADTESPLGIVTAGDLIDTDTN